MGNQADVERRGAISVLQTYVQQWAERRMVTLVRIQVSRPAFLWETIAQLVEHLKPGFHLLSACGPNERRLPLEMGWSQVRILLVSHFFMGIVAQLVERVKPGFQNLSGNGPNEGRLSMLRTRPWVRIPPIPLSSAIAQLVEHQ